jgi:PPOX class probable F420-dependent enzyme
LIFLDAGAVHPSAHSVTPGPIERDRLRVRESVLMTTLDDFAAIAGSERGLVVVSTRRADGSIQASLVNAGVLPHPLTRVPMLGFVTYGRVKLANLRARPAVAVTARSGWNWATVEGVATLIGPDDRVDGVDAERLRLLLREMFTAAGGTHDDWAEYDRVMAEQRRVAVFVEPTRIYSN